MQFLSNNRDHDHNHFKVLEEPSVIGETHGFPTRGPLDLPSQDVVSPVHTPLSGHTPILSAPATPSSHPTTPEDPGYR